MSKHITPGQAVFEAWWKLFWPDEPAPRWGSFNTVHARGVKASWEKVAAAAISAHFASIGARGGGKGTPAQARAARKNGLANRKSKGKPRPG